MSVTDTHPVRQARGHSPVTREGSGLQAIVRRALERDAELRRTSPEYQLILHSIEHGEQCAKCGHCFAADEHVYRQKIPTPRISLVGGSAIQENALVCRGCALRPDSAWVWPSTQSCPVCGRLVSYWTRHMRAGACCRRCERALEARRKREQRAEDRLYRRPFVSCETCGERFEPGRSDALYCSSACRQSAYRNRRVA